MGGIPGTTAYFDPVISIQLFLSFCRLLCSYLQKFHFEECPSCGCVVYLYCGVVLWGWTLLSRGSTVKYMARVLAAYLILQL